MSITFHTWNENFVILSYRTMIKELKVEICIGDNKLITLFFNKKNSFPSIFLMSHFVLLIWQLLTRAVQGSFKPERRNSQDVPHWPPSSPHVRESRFRTPGNFWLVPASRTILLVESGIVGFGIRNTCQSIHKPTNDWNLVPGIRNSRRGIQNPILSCIPLHGVIHPLP